MKTKRNLGDLVYSAVVYGAVISAIALISTSVLYQCNRTRESEKKSLENQLEAPEESRPRDNNAHQTHLFYNNVCG